MLIIEGDLLGALAGRGSIFMDFLLNSYSKPSILGLWLAVHVLKKILYTVRLSLALSPTVTVDSLYDDPMLSTWLLVRQSRIRLAGISRLAMA